MLDPLLSNIIDDMCWDDADGPNYAIEPEPCEPTWPPAGSAQLEVLDLYQPLFTSATWTVVLKVGTTTIVASDADDAPHSASVIEWLARAALRSEALRLRRMGVDVRHEYVRLNGNPDDIEVTW